MIRSFDHYLELISKWGVVICVFFMLNLTIANIVMRWFQLSAYWIEPMVRHLVFTAAFLGASLATSNKQHIKIDILARFLANSQNKQLEVWVERLVTIITIVATIILTIAAIDLVKVESEFGKAVFWGIHSSVLIGIIPFGVGLISLRLIFRLLLSCQKGVDN
ncbi:MAG: TRAP transporter small permease [Halobacteriovoraceae bacterium]|jgi:TRAP-type C4-dicarboxylate transport system permease small subunit|nr:TRAP transporter small permease [Halobacteriovoraceae bacterium]